MYRRSLLVLLFCLLVMGLFVVAKEVERKNLVAVDVSQESILRNNNLPHIWRSADYFIAEWTDAELSKAQSLFSNITVIVRDVKPEDSFYIFEVNDLQTVPFEWESRILYHRGHEYLLKMEQGEVDKWVDKGYHTIRLPRVNQYLSEQRVSFVPYNCNYNTVINDLLSRTSQTQWVDWIQKLSGIEQIVLGGTTYTISRRPSSAMFSGDVNAKAYDFVLWQAQSYHYGSNIEEDSYGSSGWKNIILTIPGQTTPSEIVGYSAHLDDRPSTGNAPGADDNGTGSAALLEAARLFRQFRFQRTIKIMFFTGEEDGLLGSGAYVDDHNLTGYLGVLNQDMFGYDPDSDECYEMHIGTMSSSADIANCMVDTISAYSIPLSYDYITSGATTASDHSSFWDAGIGAIETSENFFSTGSTCGAAESNPYYHTSNDTLANSVTLPFAYDVYKAAIASVAAMAIPIQACFTTAPTLTATGGVYKVDLSWTPVSGAASYRVFRSTQGCEGQWFEQVETTNLSWTDNAVTPGTTYYYYVEAVASDGFCVSQMSNCASAVPSTCTSCAAYQDGSATVLSISGGDNDNYMDNCESATIRVTIQNIGTGVAVNPAVTIIPANSFLTVTTPMPIYVGNIPVGSTVNTTFNADIGSGSNKASCNQIGTYNISVQAVGQDPAAGNTFSFNHEIDTTIGNINFPFETSLDGWTVEQGTWALSTARVNPGGSTHSVHSSSTLDKNCDIMLSPVITPTASTQLHAPNWYDIEVSSNGYWYDRANFWVVQGATETVISPSSGKLYATGTFYDWTQYCNQGPDKPGWSGTGTTWGDSVFNLASYADQQIQLRVKYMTDDATHGTGVYLDDLYITNVSYQGCDAQSDTCASANPPGRVLNNLTVSKSGADLLLQWEAVSGTCSVTGYELYRGNLPIAGSYSHDDIDCDITTTSKTTAQDTGSYYYLIVPKNNTNEGSYGLTSSGSQIPQATTTPCITSQDTNQCN